MIPMTKKSEDTPLPFRPKLFDPNVLKEKEWEPYIYTIKFGGKDVKGLSAEGYIHAVTPYLEELTPKLVQLIKVERTEKTSGYFYAVVEVTLHLRFRTDERSISGDKLVIGAMADGTSTEVNDPAALIRNVETRAVKRAVARALDLGTKDINRVLNQVAASDEDEVGTPLEKEYDPGKMRPATIATAVKESQNRVREALANKNKADAGEAKPDEPAW